MKNGKKQNQIKKFNNWKSRKHAKNENSNNLMWQMSITIWRKN